MSVSVSDIMFKPVVTPDDWTLLRSFAESFDHKIVDVTNPYVLEMHDGNPIGYFQIVRTPTFFTAWHKDASICPPRLMREAMAQLEGYAVLEHGEALVVIPDKDAAFSEEQMNAIGFKKLGNLYSGNANE